MGKLRDIPRQTTNSLGIRTDFKKKSLWNDSAGSSSSSSRKCGTSKSSGKETSSVGSYVSSKTSSSSSLGVRTGCRVKKRSYDSKGIFALPEVELNVERSTSYAREFSGILPDGELELEEIFKGNPYVWGFLESQNPEIVKSKLLERSAEGRHVKQKNPNHDRRGYLIGSGSTCDIRVPTVLEKHHCMIYTRIEYQGRTRQEAILLNDRSKKGTWHNGEKMQRPEVELKNGDIVSFKETDDSMPYLSLKIRLPTYFRVLPDVGDYGIDVLYQRKDRIGSGSFGEVYRAKCLVTGKKVALKQIAKDKYLGRPRTLQSLLQEIAVYTSLQHHPCIVRMERILEVNGAFFIAMELGPDGDLFDHISTMPNPMTEDEVKIVFDQIFHAVDYIHDQEIAHRDLKLENIIIMDKKTLQVKIADFGLATFYRGRPFETMCGTQSYAAPELVLENKCYYDKSVDIWSLGVMLFLTLVKAPPFYDASAPATADQKKDMLQRIKNCQYSFNDPERWTKISQEAKDLISNMLVVDVSKRYTIKQVLEHPWLREIEVRHWH
ncbi:kinase-like domain-containing protein [Fennellomyces sp. T-0311]|nr:kinase-like domain-containing protein [Fennellomyces sp. T-0311]